MKQKLRPEAAIALKRFIDEKASADLDKKAREQLLKKTIRQFERAANGSEDRQCVLFRRSKKDKTFSFGYVVEVSIGVLKFDLIASRDDFLDIEPFQE